MIIFIEGIDHIGKDTLIDIIKEKDDVIIHAGKPQPEPGMSDFDYQLKYFTDMINYALKESESGKTVICNRFHLGECVYAPLYRGYSGEYVFPIVETPDVINQSLLVLLYIHNIELRKYDKEAFDFENARKEQDLFLKAYEKSRLNKIIIEVDDGEKFLAPEKISGILKKILTALEKQLISK